MFTSVVTSNDSYCLKTVWIIGYHPWVFIFTLNTSAGGIFLHLTYQLGSRNFCPELRKNALLISKSYFSNFALHMIKHAIRTTGDSMHRTGSVNSSRCAGMRIHNMRICG